MVGGKCCLHYDFSWLCYVSFLKSIGFNGQIYCFLFVLLNFFFKKQLPCLAHRCGGGLQKLSSSTPHPSKDVNLVPKLSPFSLPLPQPLYFLHLVGVVLGFRNKPE